MCKYQRYDNYDAINVDRVNDIPDDYYGVIGVPISYLNRHNPDQFHIIGQANTGSGKNYDLFKPIVNGVRKYKRILIRKNLYNPACDR